MQTATSICIMLLPATTLLAGVAYIAASGADALVSTRSTVVSIGVATVVPLVVFLLFLWRAPEFDRLLLSCAAMLTSIGIVALAGLSVAPGPSQSFYSGMLDRSGLFVGGGFVVAMLGAAAGRRIDFVARYPFTLLAMAFMLTAVTIVVGDTVNGARLWLDLGPLRFQPAELSRIFLAGFVAIYLHDRRYLLSAPWRIGSVDLPPAPYLMPLAGGVLGAALVLALQNDLGMAALLVLGAFVAVAAALRSRVTTSLALIIIVLTVVAAYLGVPRVRDRVSGWLDPWSEPLGRGFQFVESDFSLASGGLIGAGPGAVAVSVPEVHTDFALVGIGSQFGAIVAAATLALSALLVLRCLINALSAPPGAGSLLAFSLSALLGIQTLLILGGTLRVIPLTGLTLPLVSYGGTSMVASLFTVGVIIGIGGDGQRPRD